MPAPRIFPKYADYPSGLDGEQYGDAVAAAGDALWKIASEPLTSIGGTANAITAAPLFSTVTAYVQGQKFSFIAGSTNTSATVTLNISGLGAKAIKTREGSNPAIGDIVAGTMYRIEYDGTNFRLANYLAPAAQTPVAAGRFDGTGTPAWDFQFGFNATITDNGSGDYALTFASALDGTDYVVQATVYNVSGTAFAIVSVQDIAASGFSINLINTSDIAVDRSVFVTVWDYN